MRKVLALVAVLLATSAVAADKSTESALKGSGTYGTAGCGLGSMAFGNTPGMIQVLAATTNGFFGTQTFGITTGTSNCGKGAMAMNGTKVFIEGNKEALAKDAARGSGETLVTLSFIAQCKDTAQVSAALQKNYSSLFPAADAPTEQVRDNVIRMLQSDKSLGCNLG
jgi:hypothetical protein